MCKVEVVIETRTYIVKMFYSFISVKCLTSPEFRVFSDQCVKQGRQEDWGSDRVGKQ